MLRTAVTLYVAVVLSGFVVAFFLDDGVPEDSVFYPPERPAPRHGLSTFIEGYVSSATLGGWDHVGKSLRNDSENREVKVRAAWWPRAEQAGQWAGWLSFAALVAWLVATRHRSK
jgi:hypothetical protein